jgi:hypothetical protein
MRMRHLYAVIATAAAALILSGCFVYSLAPPAPSGSAIDDRLIGTWYALDEHGKPVTDGFLHFIKPKDGGPMQMVTAAPDEYSVFELHTAQLPGKRAFAVRKLHPIEPGKADSNEAKMFMLGTYEIKGDALAIRVYAPDKLRDAVRAGKIKGTAGTGNFASVTLTGSPQDVARALATPEADAALEEPHTLARRLPQPR